MSSDFADNRVLGFDDRRSDGQPDGDLRGGQTRSNAHLSEPLHREFGHFRHDPVFSVHAVHTDGVNSKPLDHGHRGMQTRAPLAGHKHNGVSGHDNGHSDRPILGDRPRVSAKRTAYGVRVHRHRMVLGGPNHVTRSVLSGEQHAS